MWTHSHRSDPSLLHLPPSTSPLSSVIGCPLQPWAVDYGSHSRIEIFKCRARPRHILVSQEHGDTDSPASPNQPKTFRQGKCIVFPLLLLAVAIYLCSSRPRFSLAFAQAHRHDALSPDIITSPSPHEHNHNTNPPLPPPLLRSLPPHHPRPRNHRRRQRLQHRLQSFLRQQQGLPQPLLPLPKPLLLHQSQQGRRLLPRGSSLRDLRRPGMYHHLSTNTSADHHAHADHHNAAASAAALDGDAGDYDKHAVRNMLRYLRDARLLYNSRHRV